MFLACKLFTSMDGEYAVNRQERFQCIIHFSLFIGY
jgi:hypothetical protein